MRIMPRVSLPAAPASARKQGVKAVKPQRQFGFVQDFVSDVIGERNFCGGDQPVPLEEMIDPVLQVGAGRATCGFILLHHLVEGFGDIPRSNRRRTDRP